MITNYYEGVFGIAGVALTFFVMFYSLSFLIKVVKQKNREPWEYLMFAITIFLVRQTLDVLSAFGIFHVVGVRYVLDVLFLGVMLIAFITQTEITRKKKLIKKILYK